jgi:hypothetical protein
MKLIDQGLNQRILEIQEVVEKKDNDVVLAIEQVENLTQILLRDMGDKVSSIAHELDYAISLLLTSVISASYRIGVSEGMNLQQEINALYTR